ncbi:hypothetical protein FHR65_004097 [Xanthomonas arboricola]|uniref:Uncharacterized protein n=1 Tax=Xanthomonas arboricola TaxID=56448 RepID=A0AB73H2X9_9XANT|nr:hypothetical protein [Xanthomonas arboricola]
MANLTKAPAQDLVSEQIRSKVFIIISHWNGATPPT